MIHAWEAFLEKGRVTPGDLKLKRDVERVLVEHPTFGGVCYVEEESAEDIAD